METRTLRSRVANACDTCKLRKIRCSGVVPCAYCIRKREPDNCRYTAPRRRPRRDLASVSSASPSASNITASTTTATATTNNNDNRLLEAQFPPPPHTLEEHEDTEVPREARLLCDAQGKLIFIGDCAPLSFFQTVRRLVTTRVDAHAFAPETSGYSALENVQLSRPSVSAGYGSEPPAIKLAIKPVVSAYLEVTAGLVDLFESNDRLFQDITAWAEQSRARDKAADTASAVNYLVLAVGCQKSDEAVAQVYFDYARDLAFASLGGNLGVASVQVFILVALYSLGACQINAAFLFFGIAARAAYSIGIHRTAVNARFGPDIHRQRDRLWKSLRIVDLFLSTSMGRPPATSDVDCTVPYREPGEGGRERLDLLNASVQIFLVIESVVVEVYSRRKISARLTEGISRELREWSNQWLQRLKDVVDGTAPGEQPGMVNGACQVLSSYYYAVILVSRPFLMVELHRRLADGYRSPSSPGSNSVSGKSKLADACIDAAILMVEPIQDLIDKRLMTRRAPVVVSWLFASSLVLGVGLLGGFGRVIEKYCRASIAALEYFAETDTHARQYSLIAKSLLSTASEYLEKKEMQERLRRTESSSQLFGLIPPTPRGSGTHILHRSDSHASQTLNSGQESPVKGTTKLDRTRVPLPEAPTFDFDFEATFLGLTESMQNTPEFSIMGGSFDPEPDQTFGSLNLFPLLEGDGHIDLANYF
ncbi:hypothetical protein QBC35DRAFT_447685 [Podospora australis]|uniref:Zn(2)-C6 fungal-type domain-containing protein n=1 Tax=Podospora australis TaxID=1536484 RepID=A0AAN6X6S5_9PEZI|nr:hypothetical protein QBC35DRAFT_447685 [Podospora australis]